MTDGYLYCFSNPSMPGILKVGMTERTPEIRLNEANSSDTWRPPTPYKIEFAKKVCCPNQKEKTLHALLSKYTERINPNREFFRASPEEVNTFFNLIDGDLWVEPPKEEDIKKEENEEEKENEEKKDIKKCSSDMTNCFTDAPQYSRRIAPRSSIPVEPTSCRPYRLNGSVKKGSREMAKCFTDGQYIRHTIGINKPWVGIYDSSKNGIIYDSKFYKTLIGFAEMHYSIDKIDKIDRVSSADGWKECECEVNGKWISTYNL